MTSVLAPIYSARDSAITQRPTSTAILAIDSEDRFKDYLDADIASTGSSGISNLSPYDFTIRKNQSLMNGFFTRLGVTEIVFPWVYPNINVRTNRVRLVVDTDPPLPPIPFTDYVIEVPTGFYTPSMLASTIQSLVRAANPLLLGAFTMTYGVALTGATKPVFVYNTNNPNVVIGWERLDYDNYDTSAPLTYYPYPPTTKQLLDVLGLSGQNIVTTGLYPLGETAMTLCQAVRYIDIVCTQLTNNQALKDTMSQTVARDVLCRLYIAGVPDAQSTVLPSASTFCPPGCMPTTIYRDFSQPKQIQWIPNQPVPGFLRFEVYDDTGNLLEFPFSVTPGGTALPHKNATNWSMTLLVSEN